MNLDTRVITNGLLGNAIDVSFREALGANVSDSRATLGVGGSGANGLLTTPVPLSNCKNVAGSVLVASSPGATDFVISITLGTSEKLNGHAAGNATKTDSLLFEHALPSSYIAGANVTVTANANYASTGNTTIGNATVAAAAYKLSGNGTMGNSTLVTTSAGNISASAQDIGFNVNGASLNPGDRILIEVTASVQETSGNGNVTASINSLRVS